jgi:hypothetical protein
MVKFVDISKDTQVQVPLRVGMLNLIGALRSLTQLWADIIVHMKRLFYAFVFLCSS